MPRFTSSMNWRALSTLTVQELISILEDVPEDQRDKPVVFVCDYGDYGHTQQALGISSISDEPQPLYESGYSHSGFAVIDKDDSEDEEGPDEDSNEEEGPAAFILQ